jgi:hypothetical protein
LSGGLGLSYSEARSSRFQELLKDGTIKKKMKPEGREEAIAERVFQKLLPFVQAGAKEELVVDSIVSKVTSRLGPMVSKKNMPL